MSSTRPFLIAVTAAMSLASLLATQPAFAATPACKPIYEALAKLAATPNHQFMHSAAAFRDKPSDSEVITTANAMYVKVGAAWHSRPYDAEQSVRDLQAAASRPNETCERAGDEAVAGEAAAHYRTHDRQDDGTTVDTQLWISSSRGLPLRQVIDMDVGGKMGKSQQEIRFDYADVKAPAGVK